MSAIKIHLENEELSAVERLADSLHVGLEDIAYAALNRLMLQSNDPELRMDIAQTRNWRSGNLPLWSDTARSVHAYESKPDDEPHPSRL